MTWTCGKFEIDLASTRVMGIVNVTPDSFSDGGLYLRPGDAVAHARALVRDGADVIKTKNDSTADRGKRIAVHVTPHDD